MKKPTRSSRFPGVEGVTYPPTHWKCICGRRFIGDVRLYAHMGDTRKRGHEFASGYPGGRGPARRNIEEVDRG